MSRLTWGHARSLWLQPTAPQPAALPRVSPGRNTQQIHRQLLQAGIPWIIYIHHLEFVVLIPPAQHKTWRFMTGLTPLLISQPLQSELPPTQWHREELWVGTG